MQNETTHYTNAIELETYRKHALTAAKDLSYDEDCIKKLLFAKNMTEIACIMATARERASI